MVYTFLYYHPGTLWQSDKVGKKLYGDAQSRLKNFDHLYTSRSVICDPSLYQIATKNTHFGTNWVLFWPNFPEYIHPILQIGSGTETHPSIYQRRKSTLKPLSIPVYHQPVRIPPPGGRTSEHSRSVGVFIRHTLFFKILVWTFSYWKGNTPPTPTPHPFPPYPPPPTHTHTHHTIFFSIFHSFFIF